MGSRRALLALALSGASLPRPRTLKRGELVGIIRDYTGKVVERLLSPADGHVLYGVTGPPVEPGDSVVTIALPTDSF